MKIAIIGFGQRGMIYAAYLKEHNVDILAVVEPNQERRSLAQRDYAVPHAFADLSDFLAMGKIVDAVIVSSMDRNHYEHAMKLLDLGYDLLLEKPISPDVRECVEIQKKAEEKNCKVIVCHVLRYTNFFSKLKEIIDSGDLGKIITIQYAEYMGNYHMAHSFVRGNWRNSESSSPIILQKSCHDMDILVWLADSRCKKISSFGDLTYFKPENAPAGSALRCLDCKVRESCPYDAEKTYLPMIGNWRWVDVTESLDPEDMRKALAEGPYGRCVYHCDNNVCDHQVSTLEFENGITATFHLSAFSDHIHRSIRVMCEHGSIDGDDSENTLIVRHFGSYSEVPVTPEIIRPGSFRGRHGGGDVGIIDDFLRILDGKQETSSRSAIAKSVESHLMASAAELSRITGKTVDMKEFRENIK